MRGVLASEGEGSHSCAGLSKPGAFGPPTPTDQGIGESNDKQIKGVKGKVNTFLLIFAQKTGQTPTAIWENTKEIGGSPTVVCGHCLSGFMELPPPPANDR